MSELDDVIRNARAGFEPSSTDRERVWRSLSVRAGLAGAATALVTKSAAGAAVGATGALAGQSVGALAKLLVTSMALTFAAGGVVVGVTRYRPSQREQPPAASVPASVASAPRLPSSEPSADGAPARPTTPAPLPSAAASEPGGRGAVTAPLTPAPPDRPELARELTLLRAVRQVAASGQYERARQLLDALDQEFPRGALLEEREALRAATACEAGAVGSVERARAFLRRYPTSVYVAKVQRVCGVALSPGAVSSGSTRSFTDPERSGH